MFHPEWPPGPKNKTTYIPNMIRYSLKPHVVDFHMNKAVKWRPYVGRGCVVMVSQAKTSRSKGGLEGSASLAQPFDQNGRGLVLVPLLA